LTSGHLSRSGVLPNKFDSQESNWQQEIGTVGPWRASRSDTFAAQFYRGSTPLMDSARRGLIDVICW
jgi:hypothetical protein